MKLYKIKQKKGGKEYSIYIMNLTREEAVKLASLGEEFEIQDVDPKGFVSLKSKCRSNIAFLDRRTCLRLYVSDEDWECFKGLVRGRGLSVCRVVSGFVKAVLADEELLLEPRRVRVVDLFVGYPRSRRQRDIGRVVEFGKVEDDRG